MNILPHDVLRIWLPKDEGGKTLAEAKIGNVTSSAVPASGSGDKLSVPPPAASKTTDAKKEKGGNASGAAPLSQPKTPDAKKDKVGGAASPSQSIPAPTTSPAQQPAAGMAAVSAAIPSHIRRLPEVPLELRSKYSSVEDYFWGAKDAYMDSLLDLD